MEFVVFGNTIDVSFEQPEKAPVPILCTADGMSIETNDAHPENA